jgi:hypothetical protein
VSLEEEEDSGDGREEQLKSRMSRMIEKQKEGIARARDPGLNPDERRKASHDVVLKSGITSDASFPAIRCSGSKTPSRRILGLPGHWVE